MGSLRRLSTAGRARWYVIVLLCLPLVFQTLAVRPSGIAVAQDDKAAKPEAAEPAAEPAAQPAEPAAAPAGAAAPAAGNDAAPAPGRSYLSWIISASGPFGAMIVLESFVLVALIAMNILNLRREQFVPAALVEGFEQKLQAKDYQGAYELAKADGSMLGKVLAAGMARLGKGYEDAQAGMQEVGDEEAMNLEHKLSYIGLVVSTAPMLGLLGTVQGMIDSFRVIAESETSPKPKELALGIMTALVTTMEGLVVAIPAIFAFGLFKNKIARLLMEVGQATESLMGRFAGMPKKAPAPAGVAPATAAAPASPAAPSA